MEQLFEFSRKKVEEVSLDFFRYNYDQIKWDGKMFGLVGPRGVGKSTMLLQYIKQNLSINDTLYISADQMYFASHSLLEVADQFNKMGGKHLFIDEIHKYPTWSQELKEIYDRYNDMQVVFTGSSILDIYKGMSDLSRRAPIYEMQGLSFREYLQLFHHIETPVFSLADILEHKESIPNVAHPLPLFKEYLQRGYYPFARDIDFKQELLQVVNQTMENDIPQYAGLSVSVARKLKRLLGVVANSVPFKPQMTTLAQVTEISRNDVSDYLYYMERAGMIMQLRTATQGIRELGKVEKVYLDNPNLMMILAERQPEAGNVRETFFLNQMHVNHVVKSSAISDFEIDNKTFEVGGKHKGQRQLLGAGQGYIVKDDIEYGYSNVIPLWAFGLNY